MQAVQKLRLLCMLNHVKHLTIIAINANLDSGANQLILKSKFAARFSFKWKFAAQFARVMRCSWHPYSKSSSATYVYSFWNFILIRIREYWCKLYLQVFSFYIASFTEITLEVLITDNEDNLSYIKRT